MGFAYFLGGGCDHDAPVESQHQVLPARPPLGIQAGDPLVTVLSAERQTASCKPLHLELPMDQQPQRHGVGQQPRSRPAQRLLPR